MAGELVLLVAVAVAGDAFEERPRSALRLSDFDRRAIDSREWISKRSLCRLYSLDLDLLLFVVLVGVAEVADNQSKSGIIISHRRS